jgi:hypothetical protein
MGRAEIGAMSSINPTFRAEFARMCNTIGVDPLAASNVKGKNGRRGLENRQLGLQGGSMGRAEIGAMSSIRLRRLRSVCASCLARPVSTTTRNYLGLSSEPGSLYTHTTCLVAEFTCSCTYRAGQA